MAKGFKDDKGKFHPTDRAGSSRSKFEKSTIPEGMTLEQQGELEMSERVREAILNLKPKFIVVIKDVGSWKDKIERKIKQRKFEDDAEEDAFRIGFDRGLSFAEGTVTELNGTALNEKLDLEMFENSEGIEVLESVRDFRDVAIDVALENEQNDRQFSPFEITAKEINDSMFDEEGEQINDAVDEFEEGVSEGINFYLGNIDVDVRLA